jgi:hypothetical protein
MAPLLLAGVHYPRSIGEFRAWFSTDADCLDYLEWLRWPDGLMDSSARSAVTAEAGSWRTGGMSARSAASARR